MKLSVLPCRNKEMKKKLAHYMYDSMFTVSTGEKVQFMRKAKVKEYVETW